MIFQDDNTWYEKSTVKTNQFLTAIITNNTNELGRLKAFTLGGKVAYLLSSVLHQLVIKPLLPNYEVAYQVLTIDVNININIDGNDFNETVSCGKTRTSKRMCNLPKRLSMDMPCQQVYYIDAVYNNIPVFASVNGGKKVQIDVIPNIGSGNYLVMNYHKYYQTLGIKQGDKVNFIIEALELEEYLRIDALFSDIPFMLVMRNDTGFFDCFRMIGSQEGVFSINQSTFQHLFEDKVTYIDSSEKIVLNTGALEQGERAIIAKNLKNAELFHYSSGEFRRLICQTKDITYFTTKETTDNLKLEFNYAETNRLYL